MKAVGLIYEKTAPFFIYMLFLLGVFLLCKNNFSARFGEQHFTFLAGSFLDGHLYFVKMPVYWDDTSLYQGQHYWPLGPLPALLLIPMVAFFGWATPQGYLQFAINLLNLCLLYRIALKITANHRTSLWLSFAYVFSTAYLYVAMRPWSWYFAQVVATLFLLLSLDEFLHKRRHWLIGVYIALGVATRINLVLAVIFVGVALLLDPEAQRIKAKRLVQLTFPIIIILVCLLLYNYLRFGSIFEFGYSYQLLNNEPAVNREYGLWSFVHFPANLYYFLLKGPEPVFLPGSTVLTYPFLRANIWGMSILFTSPILLWGLREPIREKIIYLSLGTSLVMLFVVLGYYGIGVRQYGYRYALDFYPFLFLMLAYASKKGLTLPMRVLIMASFVLNSYLIPFV